MRVLFVNRPKSLWIGGDWVKMEKVAEGLRRLGAVVDISEKPLITPPGRMESYDIVHVWNFSMPWAKFAVWAGAKWKRKVVASMVYHDTDAFIPYPHQQIMMDAMDACIYETEAEVSRAERHLSVRNTHIVPNGIDSAWFDPPNGKVPFGRYVLTVGRVEPNKGQLETAMACRKLGIRYVMIGGAVEAGYMEKCLDEGAVAYPPMDQEDLKAWYAGCSAYVQASKDETWGMAVDEAGSQGAPVVVSSGFERKDIPGAVLCEHGDAGSIGRAIREAISRGRNEAFMESLRSRTWDDVARDYMEIYKRICPVSDDSLAAAIETLKSAKPVGSPVFIDLEDGE